MIKIDIGVFKVYDIFIIVNFIGDVMLDDDGSIKIYNSIFCIGIWKLNFSVGICFIVCIKDIEFNKFVIVGEFIECGVYNVEMINISFDILRIRVNCYNVILEVFCEEFG